MNLLSPVSVCLCVAVWGQADDPVVGRGWKNNLPMQRPLKGSEKYPSEWEPWGRSALPCSRGPKAYPLNMLSTDRDQEQGDCGSCSSGSWTQTWTCPKRVTPISIYLFKPGDLFQGDKSAWVPAALRAFAVGYERRPESIVKVENMTSSSLEGLLLSSFFEL